MPKVVLFQPQIPPNTGNIARTCAATKTELHLIGPLGFEISDRQLKRAGLDYWPYVDLHNYHHWEDFIPQQNSQGGRLIAFSVRGKVCYSQFAFQANDWLVFGRETSGLPSEIMALCDETVYIPIAEPKVRSLNLSVSVAIGLLEAQRQLHCPSSSTI